LDLRHFNSISCSPPQTPHILRQVDDDCSFLLGSSWRDSPSYHSSAYAGSARVGFINHSIPPPCRSNRKKKKKKPLPIPPTTVCAFSKADACGCEVVQLHGTSERSGASTASGGSTTVVHFGKGVSTDLPPAVTSELFSSTQATASVSSQQSSGSCRTSRKIYNAPLVFARNDTQGDTKGGFVLQDKTNRFNRETSDESSATIFSDPSSPLSPVGVRSGSVKDNTCPLLCDELNKGCMVLAPPLKEADLEQLLLSIQMYSACVDLTFEL